LNKNNSFLKSYKNLKVLVTGSTGFKGSWLCEWLHLLGSKVIGVGLKPEKGSIIFESFKLNKKIKQYFVDIRNFSKVNSVIKKEKPDIIFHLAAQSIVSHSYSHPLETVETNILGSTNILESVRKNEISNLVYITSDKCYLNLNKSESYKESDILGGLDNYSSSKAGAEIIFRSFFESYFKNKFLSVASARAGNVIGGGDFKNDRIVPDVIKSLKNKKKILLRNPNSTRPWQHVLEPLSGYLTLGHKLIDRKLKSNLIPSWNFGPHKKNCKKVSEIVKLLIIEWGDTKNKIIVKKNKKFHESHLLSLNINKAKKELKWQPRLTLNETIKFTVDWYKSYFLNKKVEDISQLQIDYFTKK
tara:strand:- start:3004 stop:4077 length:1074 start_codon:yes stop_codon:yes gene_type:complete